MVTPFSLALMWRHAARVMAVILMLSSGLHAAVLEAQLDRDSVPTGAGAVLTLRVSGGSAGQPEMPEVADLIIEARGQSQQTQWVNGTTTVSVTYQFVVGSHKPGDYQIPAIEVMVDGKKQVTQPLKLKVLAGAAAQTPPGVPPAAPGGQATEDGAPDAGEQRFGFLTISPVAKDRKYVYVGEIAPVCIQAWIPADARAQLRGGIQPEGNAFTLHHVSEQPQQRHEVKDGKRFLVVTWYGGISATKAGTYPASLSVAATVAVRDTAPRKPRRRMGGPFDDPFFDRVFEDMNVPMIQKDVTLKSDDQAIEVRPLPTEGRPNGFTGAVGDFQIDGWELPAAWQTGEPGQVSVALSGRGNFALMNAPDLTPSDAWKTYQAKSEFTAGDNASFSGSKRFQFSAVPRKGGAQDAALTFSYFDPGAGAYKTITSEVKKIQVTGTDLSDDQKASAPAAKEPEKKTGGKLVAQRQAMSPTASLAPLVSRPAFMRFLVLSGGLCLLGLLLGCVRVRRRNPQRLAQAALDKATREALQSASQCAAAGDVAGFFAAARLALQQKLGALWNQPAQAITLAEIQTKLPEDSPVAKFFQVADRQVYSPGASSQLLPQWQAMLDEAIASLTTSDH